MNRRSLLRHRRKNVLQAILVVAALTLTTRIAISQEKASSHEAVSNGRSHASQTDQGVGENNSQDGQVDGARDHGVGEDDSSRGGSTNEAAETGDVSVSSDGRQTDEETLIEPSQEIGPDAQAGEAQEELSEREYQEFRELPPIEELVFGEQGPADAKRGARETDGQFQIENIIGSDNRRQVTNTTVVPYRRNCQLIITAPNGRQYRGTGWFVGRCAIATAGHCVHSGGSSGAWMTSIQVIPGMNGRAMPFGSATSRRFYSVQGWTRDRQATHDYGVIILPDDQLFRRVGSTYGFAVYPDSMLQGLTVNLYGYPGDKPFGTQWGMHERITRVAPRQVCYRIDTAGGQSGSAVYHLNSSNSQRLAVAIHANGGSTENCGTRITRPVFDNLLTWSRLCGP